MKYKRIIILLIIFLLFGCSNKINEYRYNNLLDKQSIDEFKNILSSHDVLDKDIETIINYIEIYNDKNFAKNNLSKDWHKAKILDNLYNYNEAINAYTASVFDDINCREAAYIIINNFVNLDFETLFITINSHESVGKTIKEYWEKENIKFSGNNIHLISLWGNNNNNIENMHAGILIKDDNKFILFEKTDPMLPYQLSIFDSINDIKEYLLNRSNEYKDQIIFIDDEEI